MRATLALPPRCVRLSTATSQAAATVARLRRALSFTAKSNGTDGVFYPVRFNLLLSIIFAKIEIWQAY